MKWIAWISLAVLAAVGLAWATSPDPRGNSASFEAAPVESRIAPLSEAITLATYEAKEGTITTMVVTSIKADQVVGVELGELGADYTGDPLRDLASTDRAQFSPQVLMSLPMVTKEYSSLLPAAPAGTRHVGTGTNFPEHAEESNSNSVFQFPKFGTATPARTTVTARTGILLDYEVELCMRFDRDIGSLEDFDAAVKAVFLCGDFTNRNALVELADPDNLDSGFGFSDAKSGVGAYPSGPFLVVPYDWAPFVAQLRMTTSVNGEPRQDARGAEMTLDFRELAAKALDDMDRDRFFYAGEFYKLAEDGKISSDMTLMSGTSEGVIFTPPTRADIIEGALRYVFAGGPASEMGFVDAVKARFIENELRSGHFLQPGDVVRHESNFLGDIEARVVWP